MPKANVLDMFHGDNQEQTPDFAALKRDGIVAVMHKATQGTRYVDPRFAARRKAAHDAGMPFGAYHFGTCDDERAQLGHFLSTVMPITGDHLALDFEDADEATMALHQAYWFVSHMPPGVTRWLYSGDLIRETLRPASGQTAADMLGCADFFKGVNLWLAEYGPVEKVPHPWKTAAMWQFSETGTVPGIVGHVDLNYCERAQTIFAGG